jgi:hypothetical protein
VCVCRERKKRESFGKGGSAVTSSARGPQVVCFQQAQDGFFLVVRDLSIICLWAGLKYVGLHTQSRVCVQHDHVTDECTSVMIESSPLPSLLPPMAFTNWHLMSLEQMSGVLCVCPSLPLVKQVCVRGRGSSKEGEIYIPPATLEPLPLTKAYDNMCVCLFLADV